MHKKQDQHAAKIRGLIIYTKHKYAQKYKQLAQANNTKTVSFIWYSAFKKNIQTEYNTNCLAKYLIFSVTETITNTV